MDKKFIVLEKNRLDKFIMLILETSRNQVQHLIKKGFVCIDDNIITKTGYLLKINQVIAIKIPDIEQQENYTVDFNIEIIYEDHDILIVNKPTGIVVHGGQSVKDPILVDWLKSKNISLSTISGELRHGIVHRIDKKTTGLLIIAKNNKAHQNLSLQLQDKTMGRYYLAIIDLNLKDNIVVEQNLKRNRTNRLKQSVSKDGKYAKSAFVKLLGLKNNQELIACKLYTGRTHQIRAHLEYLNRHIIGDILYGFKSKKDIINEVYLHAYLLYFIHPTTNKKMVFKANMPKYFIQYLKHNRLSQKELDEKVNQNWLFNKFNIFS